MVKTLAAYENLANGMAAFIHDRVQALGDRPMLTPDEEAEYDRGRDLLEEAKDVGISFVDDDEFEDEDDEDDWEDDEE